MCDELSVSQTTLVSPETADISLTLQYITVVEKCALLGYYAVRSGNFLLMFQDKNPNGFLTPDDGTYRLSHNIGKKLPPLTV
jgi:hypothetical protein